MSETAVACLTPEVAAAYVDGGLPQRERRLVEAHLADCEDCRSLVAGTAEILEELGPGQGERQQPPRRRSLWWPAGLASAAAAVALLLLAPGRFLWWAPAASESDALVAAVGAHRPIEGRLTGGYRHGPRAGITRSSREDDRATPELVIASARIEQALVRRRSFETLTAFGAAQLVLGRTPEAIAALEEARGLRPDNPAPWIDLAAAHLERSEQVAPDAATAELAAGLDAAARATLMAPRSPEAWFNRALLESRQGRAADAGASWNQFLGVEKDPAWLAEGRRQLDSLRSPR